MMNEMDDNTIDRSLEQALELMKHPKEWSEEDIREAMKNEACMQTCKELLDCKNAMLQEYARRTPDVEKEWKRFQEKTRHKSSRFYLMIGTGIGIAASFLLILLYSWISTEWLVKEPVLCFSAIDNPIKSVTLQTTSGKQLTLDNYSSNNELSSVGAILNQTDSLQLVYAKPVEQVEMHQLITPRGQTFEVVLADGTKVWMNADSRLEYPSRFVGKKRVVKLCGEAYFHVAKDEKHPFIVETDGIQTEVLGTEFNVHCYNKENAHVTLIEGSVQVMNPEKQTKVRLHPGENARLQGNGEFFLEEVDVDTYIYWRDGYFYFDDMTFAEIMQEIGRWYNVNVIFENQRAMEYRLRYFCSRNDGIEKAVEMLQYMKKAQIQLEGNTVFIK